MPELPEITAYVDALERDFAGERLVRIRVRSPSLLRTWDPPLAAAEGRLVERFGRIGKRVVWHMEGDLHLVFHLMIAGRFHRRKPGTAVPKRGAHGAFDFPGDTLLLTERASHKRASLHVIEGREGLVALDPGGLEVLDASPEEFRVALTRENRTLKRALTDPRILSGIGNAYSDEILHKARLSPVRQTKTLERNELETLFDCTHQVLRDWQQRLAPPDGGFPEKVTAFRDGMAVHGRFGRPCPDCGTAIQRIRYASRETNYCPRCQTGGRLLADRSLSRLLKRDWPRSIDELEQTQARHDSPR